MEHYARRSADRAGRHAGCYRRGVKPADLALLRLPGAPTLSPDGTRAVVAVTRADLDDGRLPVPAVAGGHDRRDAAAAADRRPAGQRAGLVAGRAVDRVPAGPGRGQAAAARAAGRPRRRPRGDHRRAPPARRRRAAVEPGLDPAGLLAPASRSRAGTARRRAAAPDKEPPRRITPLRYRLDGIGFLRDRPDARVRAGPVRRRAAPVQVTDGDRDDGQVAWTPDGGLLFSSDRDAPENTDLHSDVYACAADGSDLVRLTPGGQDADPRSPPRTADGLLPGLDRPGRRTTSSAATARSGRCRATARPSRPGSPARSTTSARPATALVRAGDGCWPSTRNARRPGAGRGCGRRRRARGAARRRPDGRRGRGRRRTRSWPPSADATSAGELVRASGRDEPLTDFGAELTASAPRCGRCRS